MKKKTYKTPTIKVRYIGTEQILAGSTITEDVGNASTAGGSFDADAKSNIWSKFDNEE